MSYRPPPSPPLPTFAIKDLCGPSNPPALISISKRRYDATLTSNPTAALLYLDDDDGELITVGSSLELSQRLEEPVPKYIRGLRDPTNGKLVHVFDINHSTPSLFEWRDHEAYSSKHFKALSSPPSIPKLNVNLLSKSLDPQVTYPSLPESHNESCDVAIDTISSQSEASNTDQKSDAAFNLLDGIEVHLSGLANVLQIAATTLQKAADKTKETDTSVIEDILKGVKGILTEVGAFGLEAFKELESDAKTALCEEPESTSADAPDETATVKEEEEVAAQLAQEAKEEYDLRTARKDNQPFESTTQPIRSVTVEDAPSEDVVPKVKFNLPEAPVRKELTRLDLHRLIPLHARSARSDQDSKLNLLEEPSANKSQSPSFLDDSSEDADFTARYPPLSTVRRARSTIERPLQWPTDRREKAKAQCKYYRQLAAAGLPKPSPFAIPRPISIDEPIAAEQVNSEVKPEATEVVQKPLPGAWPDVKNDSATALPVSTESSGDFFNRMVGRGRPARYRTSGLESGLHRANTTASSNPASRLNGPFDPGFPYDPSPGAAYRHNTFGPYHSHRRSASPPRWSKFPPPVRSRSDKRPSSNSEANLPPSPSKSDKFSTPPDNVVRSAADDSAPRAVRHYRSVPQFHIPPSPPYQIMNTKPVTTSPRPLQRATTDFLTGPPIPVSMPMPPPMPFTTRPPFSLRSTPPNLWAPWQSSPPMQPPADEGTNFSSLNGFPTHNGSTSPVSSQSTTNGDLDIPSNEPPFPSGQPQYPSSSPSYRYPTPPRPPPTLPTVFPPPPQVEPMQVESVKDRIDECVDQLRVCGFGDNDENLKNRLHVYAVAADGDVMEAVEMIEQDRRMTAPGRFDSV